MGIQVEVGWSWSGDRGFAFRSKTSLPSESLGSPSGSVFFVSVCPFEVRAYHAILSRSLLRICNTTGGCIAYICYLLKDRWGV